MGEKKDKKKTDKKDRDKSKKPDKKEKKSKVPRSSSKGKSKDPKSKTKDKKKGSKKAPPPSPEVIAKNQASLDKIIVLLESIKPEQVTITHKVDLDAVQTLLKNIAFRDNGQPEKVREVKLTEQQRSIIRLISGNEVATGDSREDPTMTITEGERSSSSKKKPQSPPTKDRSKSTIKIDYPYEKLDFEVTKY